MSEAVIIAVCLLPTLVMCWLALRVISKVQAQNDRLLAANLALSEKPSAVAHARGMENGVVDQVGFARPPMRRPHAGSA